MPLKRKKGYRIEVKTVPTKLVRDGFDLTETNQLFSDIALFWLLLIASDPHGIDSEDFKRYYEPRFFSPDAVLTFPFDCPQPFRRAALAKAIGIYKSWRSNYQNWQKQAAKRKGRSSRPPVLPAQLRLNATLYSGMFKDSDGRSIVLKIYSGAAWKWVKFYYQFPTIDATWQYSTPSLVTKQNGSVYLNWTVERYQLATGGLGTVMQDGNRLCAVDIDLDGEICKVAAYNVEVNGTVHELARMTTTGHAAHTTLRKSRLGEIAILMSQTGLISRGFAAKRWRKIRNGELNTARKQAKQVVDFAACCGCAVIVFEHLGRLRPHKGKYSRRSNQKRAYWLKSAVQQHVARTARQNHNILTARVNPRNTSNVEAMTGEPVLRTNQMWQAQWLAFDAENWDTFQQEEGYHPGSLAVSRSGKIINAGLNACRNIALKFCERYYSKPHIVREGCVESSIQPASG